MKWLVQKCSPKLQFDHFDDRFESTPQKRYDDSSDDSNWDQVLTKNHNGKFFIRFLNFESDFEKQET